MLDARQACWTAVSPATAGDCQQTEDSRRLLTRLDTDRPADDRQTTDRRAGLTTGIARDGRRPREVVEGAGGTGETGQRRGAIEMGWTREAGKGGGGGIQDGRYCRQGM